MHTTTLSAGASSLVDCVCEAGLYKDPYGFCVECIPGSSSPVDGQGYDACTCPGGYTQDTTIYSTPGVSCALSLSSSGTHTCALFTDVGKIKCWGWNPLGALGISPDDLYFWDITDMGSNLAYVDFGLNPKVVSVQAGYVHTCVLFVNGKLKCFGGNSKGELGMGDTVNRFDSAYLKQDDSNGFVDVGFGRSVMSVYVNDRSTYVILDNKQVKSWGENDYQQLGHHGTHISAINFGPHRYAVRLFPVYESTMCALLNTAELMCWGRNELKKLGMGHEETSVPMDYRLVPISLPTGRTVVSVTGGNYIMVLLDDHTMTGWGLGVGIGAWHVVAHYVGDQLSEMGNSLTIVNIGTGRKPVQVKVVQWTTLVLLDNG
ncbi:regulator of chromosome condensation 1/beta-lactamase-inhibitor protein II, partial [Baffinella frigidus]